MYHSDGLVHLFFGQEEFNHFNMVKEHCKSNWWHYALQHQTVKRTSIL